MLRSYSSQSRHEAAFQGLVDCGSHVEQCVLQQHSGVRQQGGPGRATPCAQGKAGTWRGLGDENGLPQQDLNIVTCLNGGQFVISHQQQKQEQQMSEAACQTVDSLKGPLKGKGEALRQWTRTAEDRMTEVHQEMLRLHVSTRQAALADEHGTPSDTPFYLDIHTISKRGAKSLRWRLRGGAHATWDRIEPLLQSVAPSVAQHYREVNEAACILNAREQVARYELKISKKFAEQIKVFRQR